MVGGYDSDGTTIYVGRAFHERDWLPAKVIPSKNYTAVCYAGKEHSKNQFQVRYTDNNSVCRQNSETQFNSIERKNTE